MSIEVDNLRITKLRAYLIDVIETIKSSYNQFNIYFLEKDVESYSLDKIPTESEVEKWITGITINKDVYSFRMRTTFGADEISNIENIGFFELFEKTIKENNKKKILPDINGIQNIQCLNCGSMMNANTNSAEFDIQIQIEYREVDNETDSENSL